MSQPHLWIKHRFDRLEARHPIGVKILTAYVVGSIADATAQAVGGGNFNFSRNFAFALASAVNAIGLHIFYRGVIERIPNATLLGKIERPLSDFFLFSPVSTAWMYLGSQFLQPNPAIFSKIFITWFAGFFYWVPINSVVYNSRRIPERYWLLTQYIASIFWMAGISYWGHH